MVGPARSKSSRRHSYWDLRDTQAPTPLQGNSPGRRKSTVNLTILEHAKSSQGSMISKAGVILFATQANVVNDSLKIALDTVRVCSKIVVLTLPKILG